MRPAVVFALGAGAGLCAGLALAWTWPGPAPDSQGLGGDDRTAALQAEIERLRAAAARPPAPLPAMAPGAGAPRPPDGPTPPVAAPAGSRGRPHAPPEPRPPAAAQRARAMQQWNELEALPEDDGRRVLLASQIAQGLRGDAELARFLDEQARRGSLAVRAALAGLMAQLPGRAMQDYLLHLTRNAPEREVLWAAWQEVQMKAAITPDSAARFVTALEPRIGDAKLDVHLRSHALLALGHASIHEPAAAIAALRRLQRDAEHGALRAMAAELEQLARDGTATAETVRLAWEHYAQAVRGGKHLGKGG